MGHLIRLLLALVLLPFWASAGEKIIMVVEIWPPYRIGSADAKNISGIDIDIIKRMETALGYTIEMQRHPFARSLEMIKTGQADLITSIAKTPEREQFINYIPTSYSSVGPVFYAQKALADKIKSYEDLYRYNIGYSLDSAYFEPFNSDTKLHKTGISTEKQLLDMLVLGRLDVIIGTNPNLAYDVNRHGYKDKIRSTAYVPSVKTPLYFGTPKGTKHKELAAKIDLFFKEIIKSGEMEQILNRYR